MNTIWHASAIARKADAVLSSDASAVRAGLSLMGDLEWVETRGEPPDISPLHVRPDHDPECVTAFRNRGEEDRGERMHGFSGDDQPVPIHTRKR
ncbi:hypothetical protein [Burkholderia ubonensis]|uniref:hypothetical protein n=1 Tax=Burkholderia ubonensis TaxID=101571 RepID=UPI0013901846|nr:hypothetical protein [Burkholderia ubonensis]